MKKRSGFCVLMVIIISLLMACSSNQVVVKDEKLLPALPAPMKFEAYRIQPGDEMDIKFFYNPELNETVIVRPDGKISLQLVDEISVLGLSPKELDNILTEKYSKELRKPVLSVILRTFSGQRVFVGGEVGQPGLITLAPGMDPLQAVMQAGGLRETASPESTIVIRKGKNNQPVPIRFNLNSYLQGAGEGADFELQPDDVVFVPKSTIAQVNKFVDEVVRGLLMFNGWSFGFSYEVKRDR